MTYTYHELKEKKLSELRTIASGIEHEAVQGYTQMNKQHLLVALCTALGIDLYEHHHAVAADKEEIKSKIRALKKARDQAIAQKDRKTLKTVRREIKSLKNRLRRSMV